jgi:hypothetical protein
VDRRCVQERISYAELAGGTDLNQALRVTGGGFALNVEGKREAEGSGELHHRGAVRSAHRSGAEDPGPRHILHRCPRCRECCTGV